MIEKDQQAKAKMVVVETYSYAREYASKTHPYEKRPYPEKFAGLVQMCMTARTTPEPPGVLRLAIVALPQVLGDTYEEVIESLRWLADANLSLMVALSGTTLVLSGETPPAGCTKEPMPGVDTP